MAFFTRFISAFNAAFNAFKNNDDNQEKNGDVDVYMVEPCRTIERLKGIHHSVGHTLFVIDLDRFKGINESYGFTFSEMFLRAVCKSISEIPLEFPSWVGKMNGDKFILVVENILSQRDIWTVSTRISQRFNHPFTLQDKSIKLQPYIGISLSSQGNGAGSLVCYDRALLALKHGKEHKTEIVVFSDDMKIRKERKQNIAYALREPLVSNEFSLYIQEQIPTAGHDKELPVYEAFLRWQSPKFGAISPKEFVPIADECGLMMSIDLWVIEASIKLLSTTPNIRRINCNISTINIPGLSDSVSILLEQYHVAPQRLGIEVHERYLKDDLCETMQNLYAIKELGVFIALDGFSIENGRFSLLCDLPVHAIKINASSFESCEAHGRYALIKAALMIMSENNINLIISNVENQNHYQQCERFNASFAQGFFCSIPKIP